MTERKRYDVSGEKWGGVSYEYYAKMAMEDLARQFNRMTFTTSNFYRPGPPPTRWQIIRRRLDAQARRPFEWLRDRLVMWLGCNCDPDW